MAFVFASIGGAAWLQRRRILSAFTARKMTHIAMAHWWLIAMALFDDPWVASAGPAGSLLAVTAFPITGALPGADSEGGARSLGIIAYCASLLVLVNLSWRGVMPAWIAGLGVLTMGWGDGMAGLVGLRFGRGGIRIWGRRKTVHGTVAMFVSSFLVALLMTLVFGARASSPASRVALSLSTAGVATALELLTPLGMDNFTISVGTALFSAGVIS